MEMKQKEGIWMWNGCGKGGWFGILLGLLIIITGIVWLGNEMKWWKYTIPF
ncbi:hypothetical protein KKE06_00345 [Candidatus Micrarchaeota archaeon]|nr:hypothetical protein [Candidatus Micrarchaeota archaeon]MBU1930495.1 hypothetical protein [Candidatus Micrarchaeota archaeon]